MTHGEKPSNVGKKAGLPAVILIGLLLSVSACSSNSIPPSFEPTPTTGVIKNKPTEQVETATAVVRNDNTNILMKVMRELMGSNEQCGVMVIDGANGEELYSERAEKVFHPASTLKPIIALAALEHANKVGQDMNQTMVSASAPVSGTSSVEPLQEGEKYSLKELIEKMIIESDNQASNSVLLNFLTLEHLNSTLLEWDLDDDVVIERGYVSSDVEAGGEVLEITPAAAARFMYLLEDMYDRKNSHAMFLNDLLLQTQYMQNEHFLGDDIIVAGKPGFIGELKGEMFSANDLTNGQTLIAGVYCNYDGDRVISAVGQALKEHLLSLR